MEILKKVQFLTSDKTNNGLFRYDFLDLESNLPFSVYSTTESLTYKKLVQYQPTETKFNLVLQKSNEGKILWKVKAVL